MSPRPFRLRKVSDPPSFSGFKPYGKKKNTGNTETVFLLLEEYESMRLCDFEMLDQLQASDLMAVSRPTLTRIYARARKKVAEAFVLGKQIIIEGGKIYFDSEWFQCKSCGCYFNNPDKQMEIKKCPLCGFEKPHRFECICKEEVCPECAKDMVRKGAPQIRSL
jgi:uncharacterized protein